MGFYLRARAMFDGGEMGAKQPLRSLLAHHVRHLLANDERYFGLPGASVMSLDREAMRRRFV